MACEGTNQRFAVGDRVRVKLDSLTPGTIGFTGVITRYDEDTAKATVSFDEYKGIGEYYPSELEYIPSVGSSRIEDLFDRPECPEWAISLMITPDNRVIFTDTPSDEIFYDDMDDSVHCINPEEPCRVFYASVKWHSTKYALPISVDRPAPDWVIAEMQSEIEDDDDDDTDLTPDPEEMRSAIPENTDFPSDREDDNVNHPKHYTSHPSGVECADIAEHHDFCVGNAIKYLWRAGLKQDADKTALEKEIEDLKKAKWYIDRKINRLLKIKEG